MKNASLLLLSLVVVVAPGRAAEVRVSDAVPIVVTVDQWESTAESAPAGTVSYFKFGTVRLSPPGKRNAACLVSIVSTNSSELKSDFTSREFLKKMVRGDSRPYVSSANELDRVEVKELKIKDGLGFYANFVDPDLVSKPVKAGEYKTASPVILSLGSNYLVKATILCDEINGADYREAIKIVESIALKKP